MNGSCLCGRVTFEIAGPLGNASACHCTQCRKMSGHVWASAQAPVDRVAIQGDPAWFEASGTARRGFCPDCGSFLFWKAHDEDAISVALGAIDGPTGLRLEKHIFTATRGDYYEIADGLPQRP